MLSSVRFDMRAPSFGAASPGSLYRASLDMAEWADRVGLGSVVLSEHHASPDGFLPSPLVAAGAVVGRTHRANISISCLILPLYDPVKVAEDLAVLDLMSKGRVSTVLGLGYRPEEYEMFGAPWEERGAYFDECIQALLDAWTGQPFMYRGRTAHVTTRAESGDHPFVFVGGRSKPAARRAARFDLPFFPDSGDPVLRQLYEDECRGHGREPGLCITPDSHVRYLFVHDDPDAYWDRVGEHLLHEAVTYKGWQRPGETSSAETSASSIDELRAGDMFNVLTPARAIEWLSETSTLLMYPLCGGIPPEVAWESLETFERSVLPSLDL